MISTLCSIRKPLIAALSLGVLVGAGMAGCTRLQNTPPEQMSTEPLLVDDAMQLRNWSPVTAYYRNGDVVAGSTMYIYRVDPKKVPDAAVVALEPLALLGHTLLLPVLAISNAAPPMSNAWQGAIVEPTYTAQPPLPGEPLPTAIPVRAEPVPVTVEPATPSMAEPPATQP